jgi:DNA-directed RNA polymerase subunit RPC12/RpoP
MTIEFRCAQCRQHLRVPEVSAGKNARCPECRLLMRIPANSADIAKSADDPSRPGLPWEQAPRKSLGAFIATARLVAFQPSQAFSQMKPHGSVRAAMFYSGIGQLIGVIGMEFWHMTLVFVAGSLLGFEAAMLQRALMGMALAALGYVFIGVPLLATLGNLIGAAVLHFCLILCGGSKHPFATSIRITCYNQSSLTWLMLIPGGALAVGVWSLGVSIYAVHHAHEVPMGRAVLTVLLPMIVVMLLLILLIIIFGATLMSFILQT